MTRRPPRSKDTALCVVFGCREKADQDTTLCTHHKKWLDFIDAHIEQWTQDHPPIGTQLTFPFTRVETGPSQEQRAGKEKRPRIG